MATAVRRPAGVAVPAGHHRGAPIRSGPPSVSRRHVQCSGSRDQPEIPALKPLAHDSKKLSTFEFAALAGILVLATAARMIEAARVPMWFDEIYTLWISRLGPAGIAHALARDVHPPLHEFLVWAWWRLGGDSELWLRSLSALFGVATVAVVFAFASDLFGRGAGLLAALLLALHRTHVYYSQELRSYALLWLLETIALWSAWRFVRGRRGGAAAYAIAASAALYTHYQSGLAIACVALWGVFALARVPRRLAAWITTHVAIALAFAPQLGTFVHQLHRDQQLHWIGPPAPADLAHLLQTCAFGVGWMMLPALALALVPLARARSRAGASLIWAFALPVIAISYIATLRGAHLFTERYMDFVIPAWCALIAAGVIGIQAQRTRLLLGVAVVLVAALSLKSHQPLEEPLELRLAERDLAARARPSDFVIAADTHSLLFFVQHAVRMARYRLLLVDPALPYYEGADVIPDSLRLTPAEFARLRKAGTRWWGVRTHHAGFDSGSAFDSLRAHAAEIRHEGTLVTVIAGQKDSGAAR